MKLNIPINLELDEEKIIKRAVDKLTNELIASSHHILKIDDLIIERINLATIGKEHRKFIENLIQKETARALDERGILRFIRETIIKEVHKK